MFTIIGCEILLLGTMYPVALGAVLSHSRHTDLSVKIIVYGAIGIPILALFGRLNHTKPGKVMLVLLVTTLCLCSTALVLL
jgi:hypothetical protein